MEIIQAPGLYIISPDQYSALQIEGGGGTKGRKMKLLQAGDKGKKNANYLH